MIRTDISDDTCTCWPQACCIPFIMARSGWCNEGHSKFTLLIWFEHWNLHFVLSRSHQDIAFYTLQLKWQKQPEYIKIKVKYPHCMHGINFNHKYWLYTVQLKLSCKKGNKDQQWNIYHCLCIPSTAFVFDNPALQKLKIKQIHQK